MKNIILYSLLFSLFFSCAKDNDCSSDQIFFGSTCVDRDGFTFYKALVNEFCMPDSVMIGLDYSERLVGKWVYEAKSSSGNWNLGESGFVSFEANNQDFGYAVICVDERWISTSFTIENLLELDEQTESIDVHLVHHPNGLNHVDPDESADGRKTVQFFRQN